MNLQNLGFGVVWFVGGIMFASLAEYWAHRLMHQVRWLGKVHRRHHARTTAQGVLVEYLEYVRKLCWLMWPPFVASVPAGIGWLVGTNVFAMFSAFAHQVQHENPTKCFWLSMPIHFVHHAHNQWYDNFGVTLDVWDRVFGTYKRLEWHDRLKPQHAEPGRRIWQINWLWGGNADRAASAIKEQRTNAENMSNPKADFCQGNARTNALCVSSTRTIIARPE
jgi:sterol desaturase/sphingolipid hydroxylase (fatty acid hydroxylase superfamily)